MRIFQRLNDHRNSAPYTFTTPKLCRIQTWNFTDCLLLLSSFSFEDYDAHSRSCFRPNVASYQPNQFVPPSSTAALNAPGSQSCRHCLLIFGSPAELAVHLRTSRACGDAMKLPSAVNQPQLNAIRCQQCRKTFSSHQDLADHMKRFHNQQA